MTLDTALPLVWLLLGAGFLVANLRVAVDGVYYYYLRRRSSALLTWRAPRPPFYRLMLTIGVALGFLLAFNLAIQRAYAAEIFGEGMMFLYYALAVPLGRRVSRGFYTDGIWADGGFVPYARIDGISWREGPRITLLLISHLKYFARRLVVPGDLYGAARRLLQDKIKARDIHFHGIRLDLGDHDDSEHV
jgi:hypothetical protein